MDHFTHPRNVGVIENADGVGEVGNAKCGDIMKIYLKIENDIIVDVKFETFGCGSAIASSSMATEMIKPDGVIDAVKNAGTDKSPPYLFKPLLIKMMMTQRAEFNKNGDKPMASMSLMIFMSKMKSFLSKWTNSFLFMNILKR